MRRKRSCHEYGKTSLYYMWINMSQRITNKNNPGYKDYGGRGISICKEWDESAKVFIEWALSNGYKKGLFLDRKDNDGDYCPDNCRFITPTQSAHNTRLLNSKNTSRYRGVYFNKQCKKWIAQICYNSKSINLGVFDSPRLAALRYDAEAYRLNDGRPRNLF